MTTTSTLSGRDRAILRAVAAGGAELQLGTEPDLFFDGRCCCDQAAAHQLVRGDGGELAEEARNIGFDGECFEIDDAQKELLMQDAELERQARAEAIEEECDELTHR